MGLSYKWWCAEDLWCLNSAFAEKILLVVSETLSSTIPRHKRWWVKWSEAVTFHNCRFKWKRFNQKFGFRTSEIADVELNGCFLSDDGMVHQFQLYETDNSGIYDVGHSTCLAESVMNVTLGDHSSDSHYWLLTSPNCPRLTDET